MTINFIDLSKAFTFQVVGFFITQDEFGDTISNCLLKLRSWAPEWDPCIFWVDQDSAEQLAIKEAFPNASIILCEFHFKTDWKKKFQNLKLHRKYSFMGFYNINLCIHIV